MTKRTLTMNMTMLSRLAAVLLLAGVATGLNARTEQKETLAKCYPQHARQNARLTAAAEPLWHFATERNAKPYDYAYQKQWWQQCRPAILGYAKAHLPKLAARSDYAKQMQVVKLLQAFFDASEEESTAGYLQQIGLENAINLYGIVTTEQEIVRYNSAFTKEIALWEQLRKTLVEAAYEVATAEEGGGTMATLMGASAAGSVLSARLEDVKSVLAAYARQQQPVADNSKAALQQFLRQLNEAPLTPALKKQLSSNVQLWAAQRKNTPHTTALLNSLAEVLEAPY